MDQLPPTLSSSSITPDQSHAELKRLLEENLRYSQMMYHDLARVRRLMMWRMILGVVGLLIILTPIILALIYLPPYLTSIYEDYQAMMTISRNPLELWNSWQQPNP